MELLRWIVLVACAPEPDAKPDAPVDSAPETSDTGEPAVSPPATDTAPPIPPAPKIAESLGDCAGNQADPGLFPNQLQNGTDLHRVFLTDPEAVCNDGTAAPIYVRAATDPAHANDWIFHLQGGSDCITYEDCAIRWCGSEFYDASKMSSAWSPETIRGLGIHNIDLGTSLFSGWNHVFFYYCSSDLWEGRSIATLTRADGGDAYTLHWQGHSILESAFGRAAAGLASDDATQLLPPLNDAATVVFTGTSAGSIGAQANLDWVATTLPNARVIGVFDAAVAPDPGTLRPELAVLVEGESEARYRAREAAESAPAFGDASCEAALPDDRHWECRSSSYLPYAWVNTPFLARMDLYDPPTGDIYIDLGATEAEFASAVASSLAQIAARTVDGGDVPTVFGPSCAEHLGLEIDEQFLSAPIVSPQGPVTLHDALLATLARQPVALIDADGTLSTCPAN